MSTHRDLTRSQGRHSARAPGRVDPGRDARAGSSLLQSLEGAEWPAYRARGKSRKVAVRDGGRGRRESRHRGGGIRRQHGDTSGVQSSRGK